MGSNNTESLNSIEQINKDLEKVIDDVKEMDSSIVNKDEILKHVVDAKEKVNNIKIINDHVDAIRNQIIEPIQRTSKANFKFTLYGFSVGLFSALITIVAYFFTPSGNDILTSQTKVEQNIFQELRDNQATILSILEKPKKEKTSPISKLIFSKLPDKFENDYLRVTVEPSNKYENNITLALKYENIGQYEFKFNVIEVQTYLNDENGKKWVLENNITKTTLTPGNNEILNFEFTPTEDKNGTVFGFQSLIKVFRNHDTKQEELSVYIGNLSLQN